MTIRTTLILISVLLSIVVLYAWIGGYTGSAMERRQELRNMAERLANMDMRNRSKDFDFPIEDIIDNIKDEQLQLCHDATAARNEYGASTVNDSDDCFWFWFQSPGWTWKRGYGQAGWMVLSRKDLRLLHFHLVLMN